MPMKTTRPPGHTWSNTSAAARSFPDASNTTSAPHPSVSRPTTSARLSLRTFTGMTAPNRAARSSLGSCTSLTITRLHPAARAASTVTMPIVPAPMTRATSPGWICALVVA